MPGRSGLAWVCVVALAAVGRADPPATPVSLPPLAITAAEGAPLPNGVPVSRPLQPVEIVEVPADEGRSAGKLPTEAEMAAAEARTPLGRSWQTYELLLWWPKGQPLPPLVTVGRGPGPPALGGANTRLLVGGGEADSADTAGARFTFGFSTNEAQTVGLGVSYLFLGTRTTSAAVSGTGASRSLFVGRPLVDPDTGRPDAVPVAVPGRLAGAVEVFTSSRVTGWEVTGVANVLATEAARVNALVGYRYFMVNEGLRVEQVGAFPPAAGFPPVLAAAADQFDAHNRFHGGQLGLTADLANGPVFVEATGKVGLGQAVMVVRASGQTVASSPGFPVPSVLALPGGVLAQPTNSGRFLRTAFAVLPEAAVKVGYRFRDRSRFYLGYNFLYLSEAVRAGDQVDPVADAAEAPVFGPVGDGLSAAAVRPVPVLARSDFWVQGLVFGLEYRY